MGVYLPMYLPTYLCDIMLTLFIFQLLLRNDALGQLGSSTPISEVVATHVGNLGENIRASRALYLSAAEDNYIGSYIHSAGRLLSFHMVAVYTWVHHRIILT